MTDLETQCTLNFSVIFRVKYCCWTVIMKCFLMVPLFNTVRRMISEKSCCDFHFLHNVLLQAHFLTLMLLVVEAVASFTEWMCIGRIMWGPWRRPLPSMATQITVPMLVGEFWM